MTKIDETSKKAFKKTAELNRVSINSAKIKQGGATVTCSFSPQVRIIQHME